MRLRFIVLPAILWVTPVAGQLDVPNGARTVDIGRLSQRAAATVGPPIYRVGWAGEYDFGNLVSGVLLPDGSVAVLDELAGQVLVLEPTGRVRHVIGRRGEGPGEFKGPRSVTRKGLDTLVVEDDSNRRLSYFVEGELVRDEGFASVEMGLGYAAGRWHDGQLYWTRWSWPSPLPPEWTHDTVVRSSSTSAPLDPVARYRVVPTPRSLSPFRPVGVAGLTAGAAVAGWSTEAQFVRFPFSGASALHVRWEEASPPLTDSIWDEHVAYWRSRYGANAGLRIGSRRDVEGPLPIIGQIQGDAVGRTWIARWGPADGLSNGVAGPYRVFGPDGAWLGWVELPFRMRVLDIGVDRILAIQKNDLDVQAVVLLPFRLAPAGR